MLRYTIGCVILTPAVNIYYMPVNLQYLYCNIYLFVIIPTMKTKFRKLTNDLTV